MRGGGERLRGSGWRGGLEEEASGVVHGGCGRKELRGSGWSGGGRVTCDPH